jgi:hypothetical protein
LILKLNEFMKSFFKTIFSPELHVGDEFIIVEAPNTDRIGKRGIIKEVYLLGGFEALLDGGTWFVVSRHALHSAVKIEVLKKNKHKSRFHWKSYIH